MIVRFPYHGWLFDLDGTVYLGEALIPGAAEAIAALAPDHVLRSVRDLIA